MGEDSDIDLPSSRSRKRSSPFIQFTNPDVSPPKRSLPSPPIQDFYLSPGKSTLASSKSTLSSGKSTNPNNSTPSIYSGGNVNGKDAPGSVDRKNGVQTFTNGNRSAEEKLAKDSKIDDKLQATSKWIKRDSDANTSFLTTRKDLDKPVSSLEPGNLTTVKTLEPGNLTTAKTELKNNCQEAAREPRGGGVQHSQHQSVEHAHRSPPRSDNRSMSAGPAAQKNDLLDPGGGSNNSLGTNNLRGQEGLPSKVSQNGGFQHLNERNGHVGGPAGGHVDYAQDKLVAKLGHHTLPLHIISGGHQTPGAGGSVVGGTLLARRMQAHPYIRSPPQTPTSPPSDTTRYGSGGGGVAAGQPPGGGGQQLDKHPLRTSTKTSGNHLHHQVVTPAAKPDTWQKGCAASNQFKPDFRSAGGANSVADSSSSNNGIVEQATKESRYVVGVGKNESFAGHSTLPMVAILGSGAPNQLQNRSGLNGNQSEAGIASTCAADKLELRSQSQPSVQLNGPMREGQQLPDWSRTESRSKLKQNSRSRKFNCRYPQPEKPRQKRAVIQDMVKPLKQWLLRHRHNPYPTKTEKVQLAVNSNMTIVQVSNWFANARRRLKNVVQEDRCSWSKRLRLYNRYVQGNAELLSISSDDSIWNSEDEDEEDAAHHINPEAARDLQGDVGRGLGLEDELGHHTPREFSHRQENEEGCYNGVNGGGESFPGDASYQDLEDQRQENGLDVRPDNRLREREHSYSIPGCQSPPPCSELSTPDQITPVVSPPNSPPKLSPQRTLTPCSPEPGGVGQLGGGQCDNTNKYKTSMLQRYLKDAAEARHSLQNSVDGVKSEDDDDVSSDAGLSPVLPNHLNGTKFTYLVKSDHCKSEIEERDLDRKCEYRTPESNCVQYRTPESNSVQYQQRTARTDATCSQGSDNMHQDQLERGRETIRKNLKFDSGTVPGYLTNGKMNYKKSQEKGGGRSSPGGGGLSPGEGISPGPPTSKSPPLSRMSNTSAANSRLAAASNITGLQVSSQSNGNLFHHHPGFPVTNRIPQHHVELALPPPHLSSPGGGGGAGLPPGAGGDYGVQTPDVGAQVEVSHHPMSPSPSTPTSPSPAAASNILPPPQMVTPAYQLSTLNTESFQYQDPLTTTPLPLHLSTLPFSALPGNLLTAPHPVLPFLGPPQVSGGAPLLGPPQVSGGAPILGPQVSGAPPLLVPPAVSAQSLLVPPAVSAPSPQLVKLQSPLFGGGVHGVAGYLAWPPAGLSLPFPRLPHQPNCDMPNGGGGLPTGGGEVGGGGGGWHNLGHLQNCLRDTMRRETTSLEPCIRRESELDAAMTLSSLSDSAPQL